MTMETIELRKVTASEGMVLTNGFACGKEIYLGVNDSTDNWREIPEAEYEELLKAEAETEKELNNI